MRRVFDNHDGSVLGMGVAMPGILSIALVAIPACYGEMSDVDISLDAESTIEDMVGAVRSPDEMSSARTAPGFHPGMSERWITVGVQGTRDGLQSAAFEEDEPRLELDAFQASRPMMLEESRTMRVPSGPELPSTTEPGILGNNNDPNYAIPISLNTVYGDAIEYQGDSNWYYVTVTTSGKLTVLMQAIQDDDIDYNLYLYKLNLDTYVLEDVVYSLYGARIDEQVSKIVEPGYYFIHVDSSVGYNPNELYLFTAFVTESYDAAEPDDNMWQAAQRSDSFSVTQSIDNAYDLDWVYYTLTDNALVQMTLSNVTAPLQYRMDIYWYNQGNSTLSLVGTLSQNLSYNVELSQGSYFFRVRSESGFNPALPYTLSVVKVSGIPAHISLTSIETEPGASPSGPINYGRGSYYRVRYWLRARGVVRDANANLVANAPVSIRFSNPDGTSPQTVWGHGVTDSNGNYDILMNLPHAYGKYVYSGYSYHYYDMASLELFSGTIGKLETLYHFAYSMYRP